MESVAVFGAGGLGQLVLDILRQGATYEPVAVLDSNPDKHGAVLDNVPIRGGLEVLDALRAAGVTRAVVAIGHNDPRMHIAAVLENAGFELVSAIHPLTTIAPSAALERHLIIGPRATICVHARIGPHCVVSSGAIVEHDNVLDAGVFLHPAARLAGGVTVGERAVVGIGAAVIPGRKIGSGATVGPGAIVIRDVLPGDEVAGVPAMRTLRPAARFVPDPPSSLFGDLNTAAATPHSSAQAR